MYSNSKTYQAGLSACAETLAGTSALAARRVLVTGACGMIGTYIVELLMCLRGAGVPVHVTAMGRKPESAAERFGEYAADPGFSFLQGDVAQPLAGDEIYDYIIHAAGNAHPAAFSADPVGTMTANFEGTANLLAYGVKHGLKRFLFVSSGEVYGQPAPDVLEMAEDFSGYVDPTQFRSCYPCAKRAAETLCASYARQYGVEAVIARPCHTYGETQTAADSRAVSQFLRAGAAGRDIVLKSPGLQVRSWCHAADTAAGILTALLNGANVNAYNVAHSGSVASIREFAQTVADVAGVRLCFDLPDEKESAGYGAITRGVLAGGKLLGVGWRPRFTIADGIAHALVIMKDK